MYINITNMLIEKLGKEKMLKFLTKHKLDYYLLNLFRYEQLKVTKFIAMFCEDASEALNEFPQIKWALEETVKLRKLRESEGEPSEVKFMSDLYNQQIIFENVFWTKTLLYGYLLKIGDEELLKEMENYLSLIMAELTI